jgi:hypothetical protein
LSRLIHQREKDDRGTRDLMLGMFRNHLKQIPKAYPSSGADPTQTQVLQSTKPFLDRLTRALSRSSQEFWVPGSLQVVSMEGVPQEEWDRWGPCLYRQEVLALADGIVVEVVNCLE